MVVLDITRLGSDEQRVTAKWKTYDRSAVSGTMYEENHGEVVFESGEVIKSVTVTPPSSLALPPSLRAPSPTRRSDPVR